MRKFLIIIALLVFAGLVSGEEVSASDSQASYENWCSIRIKNLEIDSDIFYATVLPNEALPIQIVPHGIFTNVTWHVTGGRITGGTPTSRAYVAPSKPGYYPLEISGRLNGRPVKALLQIFVLVPASKVKRGYLEGYPIGVYPKNDYRNPLYDSPRGFIRVTKSNSEVFITENYRLGDFTCHQPKRYPKFMVLNEALIVKLEKVTREFKRLGLVKKKIDFLSAFRTPHYNKKPGQAKMSRHQWGSALDLFIDEGGKKYWMDDLNRDGKLDYRDGILMYLVIDNMRLKGNFDGLEGGLGLYPRSGSHGPFVHMDVRGNIAHWIRDRRGGKIKNMEAWLKRPENRVVMPAGSYIPTYTRVAPSAEDSLRDKIKSLEKKVIKLEERTKELQAGPGPLGDDEIYLAADISNEKLMMNRGKMILKRAEIERGDPAPSSPAGIAAIYSVPNGILEILNKKIEPVWFHPPWAFLGMELPGSYNQLRKSFFSGTATEVGLDLGGGSRIHVMNPRFKMVIPGCLGMNVPDLKSISSHAPKGAKVYLFEGGTVVGDGAGSKKKRDLVTLYSFLQMRQQAANIDSKYLVIDLARSRGWVKRKDKILRTIKIRRVGPNFSKAYPDAPGRFQMPRGVFLVKWKIEDPPWYKPTWLFKDQGRTVPGPLGPKRIQTELLGKYGLYLGAGIVIHGIHNHRVPDKSIDYIALEMAPADLLQVWKALPEGGVVVIK